MAISNSDEQKIANYINNTGNLYCQANYPYAGPCACFAIELIERATRKVIVNKQNIFGNFVNLAKIRYQKIANYRRLTSTANVGDVLCIISNTPVNANDVSTFAIRHYVVYSGRLGNRNSVTLGVNGFMTSMGAYPYKGVVAYPLSQNDWNLNGTFNYGGNAGNHLILFDYKLF